MQEEKSLREEVLLKLELLTSNDDFKNLSKTIYKTTVLSFVGQDEPPQQEDFSESLVNKETIIRAVVPPHWAEKKQGKGIDTKDGYIYYKNNIPVYYKNANGKLSSRPLILLKQEKSNSLAFLLSKISCSTEIGMKIPKGMVLAINEIGQFHFAPKPGFLAERSQIAKEIQQQIYKKGIFEVEVDCPYTVSDLLSIAKLLNSKLKVNFELVLSKSSSFKPFINMIGSIVGLHVGRVMVGPFKEIAQNAPSEVVQTTAPNFFGGLSYLTPKMAGEITPMMQKWGVEKSTFVILLITLGVLLACSLLGINGTKNIDNFPLLGLAFPVAVLILVGSLLRAVAPLLLNCYKNPIVRTVANLQMSTYQQGSYVVLSLITFFAGFIGINPFITVPIAIGLTFVTLVLFLNTAIGEKVLAEFRCSLRNPIKNVKKICLGTKVILQSLMKGFIAGLFVPLEDLLNRLKNKQKSVLKNSSKLSYQESYNKEFLTTQEVKDAFLRIRLAYASYAASIMLVNQLIVKFNNPIDGLLHSSGVKWSQLIVAFFAFSCFLVRKWATKWIQSEKFTDEQLTGVSFVGLAIIPILLAVIPYEGIGWLLLIALLGIGLNMSTAVPGQLDNTRLQNNVTSIIQEKKNIILKELDSSLQEKRIQIVSLEEEEKYWAGQAGKDYSNSIAKGMYGIYVAVLTSIILSLLKVDSQWIFRSIFIYSGITALCGAFKTFPMAASFVKVLFNKKDYFVVTEEEILNKKVSAKTFGIINDRKAYSVLAMIGTGKEGIPALTQTLAPYERVVILSEIQLTEILKKMVKIYNRLVALTEKIGKDNTNNVFIQLYDLVLVYRDSLKKNQVSNSLKEHFLKLFNSFVLHENILGDEIEHKGYIPEGDLHLPVNYLNYLEAKDVMDEMTFLSATVDKIESHCELQKMNQLFFGYYTEARRKFKTYLKDNPSEDSIISQKIKNLNIICLDFKKKVQAKI